MGAKRDAWSIRKLLPGLLASLSACLLLQAGCAGLPEQQPISPDDLAWIRSGAGLLPAGSEAAPEDPASLLRVTEEMRRFAQDVTRGALDTAGRTTALVNALGSKKGLHLQYDADATLTAQQVFEQRRANCLSYTLLFVALAREVDVPAQFNDVDIPAIWGLGDDTISLLYRHINARVDLVLPMFQVVDVGGEEYDPTYPQRVISDDQALAQYYNNRAAEMRLQKHDADALRYQLAALGLAPDVNYLWTNLANIYLHDGNLRAARIAVTEALALDASDMLGYDTAEHVYEQLGERRLARYFHQRAQYFLDQNPYLHYQRALAALQRNDTELAYEEAHKAILLNRKEPHFYFLMAVVLDRMGEILLAAESMKAVIDLTPDAAQQERYRSKFALMTKPG